MIAEGERSGRLFPGKTLIDATSGNTGIAYAMIAAAKGFPVKLCLPSNASPERKRILDQVAAVLILQGYMDAEGQRDAASRPSRSDANPDI